MVSRSEPLPVFRLSTAQVGGAAAFAGFQEAVHDLFDARPDGAISPEDVRADLSVVHLGSLLLSEARATAKTFERDRRRTAASGLDHVMVQLYAEGGFAGLAGRGEIRVRAGDICFLDLTRTLATRAADFRALTLVLPRPSLAAAMGGVDDLHGHVLDGARPGTQLLARHLESLLQLSGRMTIEDGDAAADATVSLIGRLAEGGNRTGPSHAEPGLLQRILDHIDRNIGDPALGPADLAQEAGISRAALYRLLGPFGGVVALIRARRLNGAARELAAAKPAPVGEIARRWGFADASTFSRAFRDRFGMAPREARSRAVELRQGIRNAKQAEAYGSQVALWLRTLR